MREAADFADAIARTLGAAPEVDKIVPGRIVRFSATGKRGDDAGWCKLFEDGRAGVFGDWRTGEQHQWRAVEREPVSTQQRKRLREQVAAAQAARAEEQAQRQARAAETARLIWSRARTCERHPYLDRKGVHADGVRVQFAHAAECRGQFYSKGDGGEPVALRGLLLLVPMRDMQWRVHSLQAIDAEGRKSFMRGARTAGLFHLCGAEQLRGVDAATFAGCLGICEGFATAWSIAHELDGWPTFAAFSAGNLVHVAREVRRKFPRAWIHVCADVDRNGRGQQAAEAAAAAIDGYLAEPAFTPAELASGCSDFNDFARLLRTRARSNA